MLALAVLTELIYIVAFLRQFPLLQYYRGDIDMGAITGHSHAGYDLFVGAIGALFVLLAIAWHQVQSHGDERLVPWILGTSAVFAVTLVFVYPITAIDIFAYVDQSWIMVHYHQNPIFVPPAAFPGDPLMSLSDGWRGIGAPYGPLGLVIDALPTLLARGDLLWNLVLLKLMFSGMVLGCAYAAYRLLQRLAPERALSGLLLIAWNPLILFETCVNGHNDIAMMLFALLAVSAMVEGEHVFGTVLLTSACLIKFATLVLLPVFLLYGLSRRRSTRDRARFLLLACAASCLVTVLAYARFWQGPDTLSHLFDQNQRFLVSFSSVILDIAGTAVTGSGAALAGRVLFSAAYVGALVIAVRDDVGFVRACFMTMFALLAVGLTNVESWYGVWPVVLAAAVPSLPERVAAVLFAWGISMGAAFFGYEWVWRGLSTPGSFAYINNKSYLLAFLPGIAAWVILSGRPRLAGTALASAWRSGTRSQAGRGDAASRE